MQDNVLNLIKCPYCHSYIIESELVCKLCLPKLNIDITISDIDIAINNLERNKSFLTKERKDNIKLFLDKLSSMINN